ncbi:MAG: hypothetical protein ACYC09_13685 [Bacteroidota bacterium]
MKSTKNNKSIRYVSLFAYIMTLVLGSGLHFHKALSAGDIVEVHAHEASSPDQSHKVIFHIAEDHQHFVAILSISAIQSRNHTNVSIISECDAPHAIIAPAFLSLVDHSPKIQYYDSRQYSPHDGFLFHSSGSDPPFLPLV